MTDHETLEKLANYLSTDLFARGDRQSQRILLGLYRMVAQGAPVSIERLSRTLELDPGAVTEVLGAVPASYLRHDDGGAIIAFGGLSQKPTGHRLAIGERVLYTWCAFDTLFLPGLLGGTARVTSRCPVTGSEIRLTVTGDGPGQIDPPDAVMSLVTPEADTCCADLRGSFCNHVNFLASRQVADDWLDGSPGAVVLSLDEAFALGQFSNQSYFKDVLAGDAG